MVLPTSLPQIGCLAGKGMTKATIVCCQFATWKSLYNSRPFSWGRRQGFCALKDISLDVSRGQVLGVIGESGSGKSTLAKAIVGLVRPSAGEIFFDGETLPLGRDRARMHPSRQKIQMVFQDPYSSLNNRQTIEKIIGEPIQFFGLEKNKADRRRIVASVLELVEMPQRAMLKYPHQFSGGQRQRIAVARALVARPQFLICDEPTSALDVSIQAQILNLLKDLQAKFGLSILFISHDLAVVRQMANQVAVLKNGRLVETGEVEAFFANPIQDYSRSLLNETPSVAFADNF
jgi:peptide/nickel transport system ATP-binding protein